MLKLKLKELIWEICNVCQRSCRYCGSKDIIRQGESIANDDVLKIAKRIAQYPPGEITLSGGEPACEYHLDAVVDILKAAGCRVKIVSNGFVLERQSMASLEEFAAIGISVNSERDMAYISKLMSNGKYAALPITVITNFGKHNIWDFDKIRNFIDETFKVKCWQVQLTMDREGSDGEYALDTEGIKYLYDKIAGMPRAYAVMADNLRPSFECAAGVNACGITYDGYVVPCLSMRSWAKDMEFQGNLLIDIDNPLKSIWEKEFNKQRFGECRCCRDCFKYPAYTSGAIEIKSDPMRAIGNLDELNEWIKMQNKNGFYPYVPGKTPIVTVYGVTDPSSFIYGVTDPSSFIYGVVDPGKGGWQYDITDSTGGANGKTSI
jgi:MoaA/NifB/PqqE/SkfB family radical SAM enzyme